MQQTRLRQDLENVSNDMQANLSAMDRARWYLSAESHAANQLFALLAHRNAVMGTLMERLGPQIEPRHRAKEIAEQQQYRAPEVAHHGSQRPLGYDEFDDESIARILGNLAPSSDIPGQR